jgi:DNA helicase-2/ATP-dependent DNA helicase PcrA
VFPHIRASQTDGELQEERRLAYVAITRAEQRLYLLRARRRRFGGTYRDMKESRFIRQIPRELLVGDTWLSQPLPPSSNPTRSRPEVPGDSYVEYDTPATGGDFRSRFDGPRRLHPWQREATNQGTLFGGGGASSPESESESASEEEAIDEPRLVRELDDDAASLLQVGVKVRHSLFGQGVVRALEGSPSSPRARVFFRGAGVRLVYLRNANLEILGD